MIKKLITIAFILTATLVAFRLLKNPWADREWVSHRANQVATVLANREAAGDDLAFLQGLLATQEDYSTALGFLFPLIEERHPDLFPSYANAVAERGFPGFGSDEAIPRFAEVGGQLLQSERPALSAMYFEEAYKRSEGRFQDSVRSEWAFFAGYCFDQSDQLDRALEMYQQSIRLNRSDWRPHRQIGLIYMARARSNSDDLSSRSLAKKYLSSSLKLNSDQPDLKLMLMELIELGLANPVNPNASLPRREIPGAQMPQMSPSDPTPKPVRPGGGAHQFKAR